MRIRGERECKHCGTRWSYYETGSVDCPACGSLRSVGVDERKRHTDGAVELDLSGVLEMVEEASLRELTDEAKTVCRSYVRSRGFIRGGELRDLDDTYLAASELVHVADVVGRSFDPTDAEELYLLGVIRGAADGDRPGPDDVPESMRAARGLAYADAVRDYRRELDDWIEDRNLEPLPDDVRAIRDGIETHVRRIRALSGDVDPREVERLVETTRDLATYLREDDETALSTARDRIDRLGE